MAKLHPRYNAIILPLIVTCIMTLIVSGVSTLRAIGLAPTFVPTWLSAWLMSWAIAFPVMVLFMPYARRITAAFVEPPKG